MLKKNLIKRIEELQKEIRDVEKNFFKVLKLVGKEDMKIEVSESVLDFGAYDIRLAHSKKKVKWNTYAGVRMYRQLSDEMFIKVVKILIRDTKRYEKEKRKGMVKY